jgi:anaerobic C4-dicarboxylate transporter
MSDESSKKTIPPTAKRAVAIYVAGLILIVGITTGAEILSPSYGPLLTLISIISIVALGGGTAILGIDLSRAELEDSSEPNTERGSEQ